MPYLTILYSFISGACLAWAVTLLSFKYYIIDKSEKMESVEFTGKNYFFMTQEQIQNACKSIIKSFPWKVTAEKAMLMEYTLNLADNSAVVKMLIPDSHDIGINKTYKIIENEN